MRKRCIESSRSVTDHPYSSRCDVKKFDLAHQPAAFAIDPRAFEEKNLVVVVTDSSTDLTNRYA